MLAALVLLATRPWYIEGVDSSAIVGVQANFSSGWSRGTGFFVDRGVVATCCHVIFPQSPEDTVSQVKIIDQQGNEIPVKGVLGMDPRNDVCLIAVGNTRIKPLPIGSAKQARFFVAAVPYKYKDNPLLRPIRLEFIREDKWSDGTRNLVVSAGPVPGYSGSPLFSDPIYGPIKVVGMISATGEGDIAYVVEPEPILALWNKFSGAVPMDIASAFDAYKSDPAGLRQMARCAWAAGDYSGAEGCYLASLQSEPYNPTTHEEYASLLWTMARERNDQALLRRAEEHYRQASAMEDDPRLHELLAFLYLETKRYAEAGKELDCAASLYERRGQLEKADSLRFQMKSVSSLDENIR